MNLLSPTMGDLISIPSQDMIIGLYIQNDQKSPRHYGN
jgi:DNA-directed RNA polymerase beta' subunit